MRMPLAFATPRTVSNDSNDVNYIAPSQTLFVPNRVLTPSSILPLA